MQQTCEHAHIFGIINGSQLLLKYGVKNNKNINESKQANIYKIKNMPQIYTEKELKQPGLIQQIYLVIYKIKTEKLNFSNEIRFQLYKLVKKEV